MDKIFIKDLRIEANIGIFDWEREVKQVISVDLEILLDIQKANKSDKIVEALDYKKISKRVISLTQSAKSKLIEHLAENIAKMILSEFNSINKIKVTVQKPGALRGSKSVGISIERP